MKTRTSWNKKWTEKAILEDAKKYDTKMEWKSASNGAYCAASRMALIDKACSHMRQYVKKPVKWTKDTILNDAKKYKTRAEWKNASTGYKAAQKMNILDLSCSHMKRLCVHGKWTEKAILEDAKKYQGRKQWQINSPGAYAAAVKKNLINKCSHMGSGYIKWTAEMIAKDAKKYKTKAEWKKNSVGYAAAQRRNILDKVCRHMHDGRKIWTMEEILKEAGQHETLIEWRKRSNGCYQAAISKGLLEKACAHMKRAGGASKAEQEILTLIKRYYPKAQTLRDRKINIPNKPHIKGFHIDIYIPELRKGIEFNGTYWHSVEGLKRSRSHWPKEDLENYHLLKTEHFAKKGIKILHIDELEWNENQQKCLDKIKKFLNIGGMNE